MFCLQLFEISFIYLVSSATIPRIPKGNVNVWASPYFLAFLWPLEWQAWKVQQAVIVCALCISHSATPPKRLERFGGFIMKIH